VGQGRLLRYAEQQVAALAAHVPREDCCEGSEVEPDAEDPERPAGDDVVPREQVEVLSEEPGQNESGRKNVATQPNCFMVRFILLPTVDW
jgi:hypothetical protein